MVVDHSDRNIDTTFGANFFKSASLLGSRRAEGRWAVSLCPLKSPFESPRMKPARRGVTESRVSPKKLPSSSLSKQQECSVNFICFGFATVILKLQDTLPLNIVRKKQNELLQKRTSKSSIGCIFLHKIMHVVNLHSPTAPV